MHRWVKKRGRLSKKAHASCWIWLESKVSRAACERDQDWVSLPNSKTHKSLELRSLHFSKSTKTCRLGGGTCHFQKPPAGAVWWPNLDAIQVKPNVGQIYCFSSRAYRLPIVWWDPWVLDDGNPQRIVRATGGFKTHLFSTSISFVWRFLPAPTHRRAVQASN